MRYLVVIAILVLLIIPAGALSAQEIPPASPPDGVVVATLFYLPTCPHCHEVMNNVLPPIQAEYGDQLHIMYIDVSTQNNGTMMYLTCDVVGVPSSRCGSVPLMVIGQEWMLGSVDIPTQMPNIVRDGLVNGGIGLPDVRSLQAAYEQAFNSDVVDDATDATGILTASNQSIWDKLANDPTGNAIAITVLVALIVSVGVSVYFWQKGVILSEWGARIAAIGAGFGVLTAFSLVLGESEDVLPQLLATAVSLLLCGAIAFTLTPKRRQFALPTIAIAGLIIAGYLSYIETTETTAVCGLIGECGTVQASSYAQLFGVLPIGVLGIIGYGLILAVWGVGYIQPEQQGLTNRILVGMALFGVLFSIYLTFLEPFVIGATCLWCITSALTMLATLWLVVDYGLQLGKAQAQHA